MLLAVVMEAEALRLEAAPVMEARLVTVTEVLTR